MAKDTADILGTEHASFTITLDSSTIVGAKLIIDGQNDKDLNIGSSKREVTIDDLPAGDSKVMFALFWAPQEKDATIDVGEVMKGEAMAPPPKQTIDAGKNPGFALLFGQAKASQ